MRTVPPGMAAAISAGATTFCRCWRLTRADGLVLGFTDHDVDLTVDGTLHAAGSGLEGSAQDNPSGLAVGGGEISGALSSNAISEADISAGLWDGAAIELHLVDWRNPSEFLLIEAGVIGEIRRSDFGFVVEMRSPAAALDQPRGRLFQAACAADLGDARCRIDLSLPAWRASAVVSGGDGRLVFAAGGLDTFADGLFTGGSLLFTGGGNAGMRCAVRQHRLTGASAQIALWTPPPQAIAAGDAFTITAGCDKAFATCRDRFANSLNFRGFPNMPGNDFVLGYVRTGEPGQDGGSLLS